MKPFRYCQSKKVFCKETLLPVLGALCVFFLIINPRHISYASGDSLRALLVSQSVIKNGTIKLDKYVAEGALVPSYKVVERAGHYYYYFPLGTSFFSIPFVWIANLLGKDMAVIADDMATQKVIYTILCVAIYLLLYRIGRCYISATASFIIITVSFLGSSLISTMGTALWNMDFTVFFESLSLLLLALYDTGRIKPLYPYLLGFFLFAAFLCRPNSAFLSILAIIYLALKNRQALARVVIALCWSFFLLVSISLLNHESIFMDYYQIQRIMSRFSWLRCYGQLLSPSRGIFIFSPFLMVVLAAALLLSSKLKKSLLFWLCGCFLLAHLVMLSKFAHWWAGHSYGPRYWTDAMPVAVLFTIVIYKQMLTFASRSIKICCIAGYLVFGSWAIFINTAQGLYNDYTRCWNPTPDIDKFPEYLFDWQCPQFLASRESLESRNKRHLQSHPSF